MSAIILPHSWWEFISDKIAIRHLNNPYDLRAGFTVPEEAMDYFNIDVEDRDRLFIFRYNNKDYQGVYRPSDKPSIRIFWEIKNDLQDCINIDTNISYFKFEKLGINYFEVSFWDKNNNRIIFKPQEGRIEGKKIEYSSVKYERDPRNRNIAIRIHGYKCMACGFDFEATYGELGKEFIEVHHSKPLSTLDGEININPKKDLVCLCSNCHSMIHRNKIALTLNELKEIISKTKKL